MSRLETWRSGSPGVLRPSSPASSRAIASGRTRASAWSARTGTGRTCSCSAGCRIRTGAHALAEVLDPSSDVVALLLDLERLLDEASG